MKGDTVLIIGDVHARYDVVDLQVRHAEDSLRHPVDQVVVLGDFGFFDDQLHEHFRRRNRRFLRPVATIEGNHEDHGALPDLVERFADVVRYLPRGSLCELGETQALCLGGARYMDAWSTPRGSEISRADLDACLAHDPAAVDLVLTHDCPSDIGVPNTPGLEHYGRPGVPEMARLAARYRPRCWLFGHHHRWFDRQLDGTRYIGLPQSWDGYVLLGDDGRLEMVDHAVTFDRGPWWRRWFGSK